jgi:predicted DNA-binding transcriptional regulator YafY
MLSTAARLLRLLTLLQARASWAGPELALRLEITARTLRRDIDRLRSLGYACRSSGGVAGGYHFGAGTTVPPLMLDGDEAVAVALALRTAAGATVKGIEDAGQRALVKLEQALPTRLQRRVKALDRSIVRLPDTGPSVTMSAVAALAAACSDQVEARFRYRDHGGQSSARVVEPYRLVHMERRWYLLAWDKQRDDWRTFRVDRIEDPAVSERRFAARPLPAGDAGAYVAHAASAGPYRFRASVILHAPIGDVRPRMPATSGQLEPIDDRRCRLHLAAPKLEGLAVMLGALDLDFEVEQPPALVALLGRAADRLRRASRLRRARPPRRPTPSPT